MINKMFLTEKTITQFLTVWLGEPPREYLGMKKAA